MSRNTDFTAYFVAKWKDGQFPKCKDGNTIVQYDQTSHAYDIASDDMEEFIEWVADTWQTDYEPREEDEEAEDYLERRCINVRGV